MLIDTDHLVVGAGATGLAFADALVSEAYVEVTLVDRQEAPVGTGMPTSGRRWNR